MMRRPAVGRLTQAGLSLLGQNVSGQWGCGGRRMVHHCSALVYREHTANIAAVRLEQLPLPALRRRSVRVRMLAAPVNPADLNMVQGTYPVLCPLPAVGGNEGVGEVLEVGDDVHTVRPGDWVVPVDTGFGTWRTEAVCEEDDLITVPKDISVLGAATIAVNPCTAFRMLHDFQALRPGCTVIQNGANSAVGQAVIQIAAAMGIRTINIIRDRPNRAAVVKELQTLGADYVLTEEEVMSSGLQHVFQGLHPSEGTVFKGCDPRRPNRAEAVCSMADFLFSHSAAVPALTVTSRNAAPEAPKPKLGLNCVGGVSGGLVLSSLDYAGTLVTYGGMAKKPLHIPAKFLIFKNITLQGFWMTQWKRNHRQDKSRLRSMLDAVCGLVRSGHLIPPNCVRTPFPQYSHALHATLQPLQRKHVLLM